jgi:hypothetical protein
VHEAFTSILDPPKESNTPTQVNGEQTKVSEDAQLKFDVFLSSRSMQDHRLRHHWDHSRAMTIIVMARQIRAFNPQN